MRPPAVLVTGDPRHGVTRWARELRDQVVALGPADPDRVHVAFTDRLHGRDADEAAGWFERLARDTPASVTLHDLPQASDGTSYDARAACYRRVVAAARAVACNSEHERALLDELVASTAVVVPLPMPHRASDEDRPRSRPEAAVLGWFYPGKGHAEVGRSLARLRTDRPDLPPVSLTALGAPSPGHEAELDALLEQVRGAGVRAEVTGYLPDDELLRRCREAAVPVVAHQHVSASGSLNSWVAAGRRPLVRDGRYARETAALRPGTCTLFPPDGLADAVAAALEDPGSTWLADDVVLRPHPEDTAAAYLRWWSEDVPW